MSDELSEASLRPQSSLRGRPAITKTKDFVESLIAAKDRVNQYPGVFYVDNGLFFCSTCSVVVDHVRKSVFDKHLELYCLCIRRISAGFSPQNNGYLAFH